MHHTCSSCRTAPGVGLSTKVGAARFIKALSTRLGQELKPAAPALLKPLIAAVSAESSMQVKRAYAGAAAALAVRCVGDKRRDKFVADAVAAYGAVSVSIEPYSPGSSSTPGTDSMNVDEATSVEDGSRQAGGLLLRELLRESSDTFQTYASQVNCAVYSLLLVDLLGGMVRRLSQPAQACNLLSLHS